MKERRCTMLKLVEGSEEIGRDASASQPGRVMEQSIWETSPEARGELCRLMKELWEAQWQEFLKMMTPIHRAGENAATSEASPWEDPKGFLASFEQVAKGCQWLKGEWIARLLPALSGDAEQAFRSLEAIEQEDYGKVKAAILRGEGLRMETQRQHFRQFSCQEVKDPRRIHRQVQELCHQWLKPERHSKEQILEFLILEQFLASLPQELQAWIRAEVPDTCSQAVALAEEFLKSQQESAAHKWQGPLKEECMDYLRVEERAFNSAKEDVYKEVKQNSDIEISVLGNRVKCSGPSTSFLPPERQEVEQIHLKKGPSSFTLQTNKQNQTHLGQQTMMWPVLPEDDGNGNCFDLLGTEDNSQHLNSVPNKDIPCTSTSVPTIQELPWIGYKQAFSFVSQKGKNVIVRCNYCLPALKTVSTALTSASNLKRHLQRQHPNKAKEVEALITAKKRGYMEPQDLNIPLTKIQKLQPMTMGGWAPDRDIFSVEKVTSGREVITPERWAPGRETVTQHLLDQRVMDFIMDEALPLETVEKQSFIELVRLGLPKDLTIMSARTLQDRLEKKAWKMREELASRLDAVTHVATTVDCWSSGKNTYFVVMAHWINAHTLKREFCTLACRCLKGVPPIYEALAKALHDVHVEYNIHNKVVCIMTDSGLNTTFQNAEDTIEQAAGEENSLAEFVDVGHILDTAANGGETEPYLCLPPHSRCATHILNLVATQDVERILSSAHLAELRKHFQSLLEKSGKLWAKQAQSTGVAEYIHLQCGVFLKVPNKACWNSTYDALKQIRDLFTTVPQKLISVMEFCSINMFTAAETQIMQEYVEIMGPLAQCMDILQKESGMFMGYLLPSLYALDRKLDGLEKKPVSYTYCLPLLKGLREGLRKRFESVWDDQKLFLAACLHPRFKVDWLETCETGKTRSMMESLLKAEIRGTGPEENEESSSDKDPEDNLEDDFFNIQSSAKKPVVGAAEVEVMRFLESPSRELSSLHSFPRILKCFLEYNTGLPSSMAVERLLSTMPAKRHFMSDDMFEHLVLLKQNKNIF